VESWNVWRGLSGTGKREFFGVHTEFVFLRLTKVFVSRLGSGAPSGRDALPARARLLMGPTPGRYRWRPSGLGHQCERRTARTVAGTRAERRRTDSLCSCEQKALPLGGGILPEKPG
jgi:hypothetical protein